MKDLNFLDFSNKIFSQNKKEKLLMIVELNKRETLILV